ncbi:alpha/beta hydrolase [Roseibacterium sp. SDUM158017]|uniref:alpha/beta fold hydrolase n=1 Tax=Roseicyclus salinarum TaxID=3036773 RepID=UPI0024150976|nr:alpha/beta hydrolase [Roseibacterium sp. SDUM158017]MDG4649752.1 alpha/beta hydrolase [Roseibacterium sp. SDUM158017]
MTRPPEVNEAQVRTARLSLHVLRSRPDRPEGRVLLLGGSNFDLRLKRNFLESELARRFEILTYEPRGIGRSERPDGAWSMEDYARDADALMAAAGWDSADVLGESFGGMTALHLAHRFPHRVARLAVASAAAGGAGGSSADIAHLLEMPRRKGAAEALMLLDAANVALRDGDPDAFAARLDARLAFETAFADPALVSGGYRRLLAARAAHDVWDALPRIAQETLVITGSRDRQAPPEAQAAMARRLPNAEHWVYDCGHGVAFATAQPMRELCARWAGPGSGERVQHG